MTRFRSKLVANPKLAGFFNPKPMKVTVYLTVDLCPIVWLPYAPEYVEKPLLYT